MRNYKSIMWIVAAVMLMMAGSCGDEEDVGVDDYYMRIQSQVPLTISEDVDQGTMTEAQHEVLSKTISRMKAALTTAHSEKNSRQANDAAVLRVCDSIYNDYATAYAESKGNTVCIVTVIRTQVVDGVAQDAHNLKTYNFWDVQVDPQPPTPSDKIEKPVALEQVDLGLSVLWANINLGGKTPDDYGGHYAWGDPTGKLWSGAGIKWTQSGTYTWDTDNYGGNNPPTDISGSSLDIIAQNWGDGWRLPTYEEAKELCEKCQWVLRNRGDIKWYEVIGPNGNSIIFKLAGYYGDDLSNRFHAGPYFTNEIGYYWTSTICPTPAGPEIRGYELDSSIKTAWFFYCRSSDGDLTGKNMFTDELRALHFSIRAVHDRVYQAND